LRLEYEEKMNELQDEVVNLKQNSENKKLPDDEKFHLLTQQLEEQEILLNGYQQENERLYAQLKKKSDEIKNLQITHSKEVQKYAAEVSNAMEKVAMTQFVDKANGMSDEVLVLQKQVLFYQEREKEHKAEIHRLEGITENVGREKGKSPRSNEYLQHKIDDMEAQLKLYQEKSAQIGFKQSDLDSIKEENEKLKTKVSKLEETLTGMKLGKSQDEHAIKDLKRQVGEMNGVIKRRREAGGDTVPSLLNAASPHEVTSATLAHLQKRVRSLEEEMEEKDMAASKKKQEMEKRFQSMNSQYDDHIKSLERQIEEVTKMRLSERKDHASKVEFLNDRIEQLTNNYEKKVARLKKLDQANSPLLKENKSSTADMKELDHYMNECKLKEIENGKLREQMEQLQNKIKDEKRKETVNFEQPPTTSHSTDHLNSAIEKLRSENELLAQKISTLNLEAGSISLKHQAELANMERKHQIAQEALSDKLQLLEDESRKNIPKADMKRSVEKYMIRIGELERKCEEYELLNEHLQLQLRDSQADKRKIAEYKVTESKLRGEIDQLQEELDDAKKHHSPAMHHFKQLQLKINSIEHNQHSRQSELESMISSSLYKHSDGDSPKLRLLLREKEKEIEKFRTELDSMLNVIMSMQRQQHHSSGLR